MVIHFIEKCVFYLLGFDHMNEEDEKVMFSRQKEILNALNIERK